jgi:hypothetical protein
MPTGICAPPSGAERLARKSTYQAKCFQSWGQLQRPALHLSTNTPLESLWLSRLIKGSCTRQQTSRERDKASQSLLQPVLSLRATAQPTLVYRQIYPNSLKTYH